MVVKNGLPRPLIINNKYVAKTTADLQGDNMK